MSTPSPTRNDLEQSLTGSASGSFGALPRLIAGRYLLQEVIAVGGMGVVYRAVDQRLQRPVAVKQMLPHSELDERERFAREARIAAGLHHANIVAVHDGGIDNGLPFLVMDLVEGDSLDQHLTAQGALDPRAAAEIARALAQALQVAHAAGVLHRDLKPANVLLRSGVPLLTDFGLAHRVEDDRITLSGTVLGTPAYMSPEQARAEPLDARTDVYGLGACLYHALAGTPPHESNSIASTLLAVIEREPDPLLSLRPDLDPDLAAICHRCLQKDPARRYPAAEALADDLRRWLDGEQIEAPPTDPANRLLRPLIVALVTACLLAPAVWIAIRSFNQSTALLTATEAEAPRPTTFLQQGLVHYRAERWLEAERLYDKGLALVQDAKLHAALLANRGDARGQRGAYEVQIEDYDASLALVPDQAGVLHRRGVALARVGRIDAALRDFNRALELDPTDPRTWIERAGHTVQQGGAAAKVLADADRAAALNPTEATLWRRIGVLRFQAGDRAAALKSLDRAVSLARTPAEQADAHAYRGVLLSKAGKLDAALAEVTLALRSDPNHDLALGSRINICIAQKRLDLALATANHLVRVQPRLAGGWALRGRVHKLRDRRDLALRDFDLALKLDPKNVNALNWRAGLKEGAGDHAGAMADYRRLGEVLGPKAVSQQAQIRAKLEKLRRLQRAAAPR